MNANTAIKLLTTGGLIQYFESTQSMLDDKNQHGKLYEIRNSNELWHKGFNTIHGKFEKSDRK